MADHKASAVAVLVTQVAAVALAWTFLFELNHWLFASMEVNQFISWVFLPAPLRVLTVLVLRWRGALGVFIGSLFTHFPLSDLNVLNALALSGISALAPFLAVSLAMRCLHVSADLAGLTFRQLAWVSLLGVATSAVAHNVYFSVQSPGHDWVVSTTQMFVGDMVGTMLVLYVCVVTLRSLERRRH